MNEKKKFAFLFQDSKVLWKNVFCFDEDKDARKRARAIEANICEISKKGEHTTQNNSPFNNENFIRKGQGN